MTIPGEKAFFQPWRSCHRAAYEFTPPHALAVDRLVGSTHCATGASMSSRFHLILTPGIYFDTTVSYRLGRWSRRVFRSLQATKALGLEIYKFTIYCVSEVGQIL